MLEDVVRLVAVTGAQLHKNRCAYLLEAKFYDFGMDCLAYCCCVDVCIVKVEVGRAKSNGAILLTRLQDLHANIFSGKANAVGFAVVGLVVSIKQVVRFAVMVVQGAPFNLIM